jgi:hypothetical protein
MGKLYNSIIFNRHAHLDVHETKINKLIAQPGYRARCGHEAHVSLLPLILMSVYRSLLITL